MRDPHSVTRRRRHATEELRWFYRWWCDLGPKPTRDRLDPLTLGSRLGRIILLERTADTDGVFRIIGDDLQRVLQHNPTGKSIWKASRIDPDGRRTPKLYADVMRKAVPFVGQFRFMDLSGHPAEIWVCAVPFFRDDGVSHVLTLAAIVDGPPRVPFVIAAAIPIRREEELDAFFAEHALDGLA